MDVDAFDTDYGLSRKGKGKLYEVDYDTLSQADIEKSMKEDVENISGIFSVDVSRDCTPWFCICFTYHNAG